MPIQKTKGFVLNRTELRETSLIVTFYTQDFGKIRGVVKGILSPLPRYSSRLQPFSLNGVVFYDSPHRELCRITQCELEEFYRGIRDDLEKTAYGCYFAEFLDSITQLYDVNRPLFELLGASLSALSDTDDNEAAAYIYQIKCLSLSGFMPHLSSCIECGGKMRAEIHFSRSLGGLLCGRCRRGQPDTELISNGTAATIYYIEKADFTSLSRFKIKGRVRDELEHITRGFIDFHIERRLKSLKFIEKLSRQGAHPKERMQCLSTT